MSYKYIFLLILFCSVLVSFTFIISAKTVIKAEEDANFKKEYEADYFDLPVGKPVGKGYYNAQKFGENNHLGDDWNGLGGGDTDYGDSIYSIANGQVTFAKDIKGGWGKVIRIKHKYKEKFYESLYAHCSKISVSKGEWVRRGQFIGNIGDCEGRYKAHLHLELRDSIEMPVGGGYSKERKGYINPSKFIENF